MLDIIGIVPGGGGVLCLEHGCQEREGQTWTNFFRVGLELARSNRIEGKKCQMSCRNVVMFETGMTATEIEHS